MSAVTKRLPALFRFSVQDGLGANGKLIARSYGVELEGVLSKTSPKWLADRNGLYLPTARGVAPLGWIGGAEALLLEAAATNLALRSQELDHATWTDVGSPVVTANAQVAPDGTTTADTIADTSAVEVRGRRQTITIANDGAQYCGSAFVRKRTSAHSTGYVLCNLRLSGGSTIDAYAVVDAFNGTILKGAAGDAVSITSIGNYWRVSLVATNNTSGNTSLLWSVYPGGIDTYSASTGVAGQGTETFWGVQVEVGGAPSSYIPTTTATVTRAADSLYFPLLAVPQELTAYLRGVERFDASITQAATSVLWSVTDSAGNDAKMYVRRPGTATGYRFVHEPVTSTETTSVGTTATVGSVVELRSVLSAAGEPRLGASIDSGTEGVSAVGTAQALASAWSAARLYLNAFGASNAGAFAFRQLVVAPGTKSLAEMRALAEVG